MSGFTCEEAGSKDQCWIHIVTTSVYDGYTDTQLSDIRVSLRAEKHKYQTCGLLGKFLRDFHAILYHCNVCVGGKSNITI